MTKLFLAILTLLTLTVSSCREFKEVNVIGIDSFNIKKIDQKEMQAEVKLLIKNSNSFGFSIYPSEFDLVFSGMHLGKSKLHKRVHIDGNEEKVYSFDLKTNLSELNFLDVAKLLSGNNSGKLEIKGNLRVGKFYVKKKFAVNYSDQIKLFNK